MQNDVPRNGALSGMIITGTAAAVAFPIVYFNGVVKARFSQPIGDDAATIFLVGALVMAVHKVESFLEREYEQCPVYITQARSWGGNPARAIFLSFAVTFIGMLLLVALAISGPPWHLAIITVWLAHGLHELHHMAKSMARRHIYPGLLTSILFVAVQSWLLFPTWHDLVVGERGVLFDAYYLALPIVLLAFYVEDRAWISHAPRYLWDPTFQGARTVFSIGRSHPHVRRISSGHR